MAVSIYIDDAYDTSRSFYMFIHRYCIIVFVNHFLIYRYIIMCSFDIGLKQWPAQYGVSRNYIMYTFLSMHRHYAKNSTKTKVIILGNIILYFIFP